MNKLFSIFDILKNEGKLVKVLLYVARETVDDPYEKTTTKSYLNPITVKGMITPLSLSSLRWKYYGNLPSGSIQLIVEPGNKNLILLSDKIQVGNNYYHCWKDDSKNFQFIQRNDYIAFILGIKNAN